MKSRGHIGEANQEPIVPKQLEEGAEHNAASSVEGICHQHPQRMTQNPDCHLYTFFLTACGLHTEKTRESTRELYLLRQYLLKKIHDITEQQKVIKRKMKHGTILIFRHSTKNLFPMSVCFWYGRKPSEELSGANFLY
jgi:hypothetical protein